MKTTTFTLKLDCEHCGQMVAVNGPARSTSCSTCQKQITLSPAYWGAQIGYSAEGTRVLNNAYRCITFEDNSPRCSSCDRHFPLDESLVGQDTTIPCPHCGTEIGTFPAPDWLKQELPAAIQLVGADREEVGSGSAPIRADEQTQRPVVLNCPNCAAPLRVTSETERTTVCGHCEVDVYLPDGIWRRLHPVQTVHPWSVVYQGKLETAEDMAQREEDQRRHQAHDEREHREDERARAAHGRALAEQERQQQETKKKEKLGFVVGMVVIIVTIIIVTLLGTVD